MNQRSHGVSSAAWSLNSFVYFVYFVFNKFFSLLLDFAFKVIGRLRIRDRGELAQTFGAIVGTIRLTDPSRRRRLTPRTWPLDAPM